jgi:uncharacterized protein YdaU (DUF1376 family)
MHYYQHHIGDFIKDTSFLTNEEIGIYLKLIWLYYDTEKPLPNNLFELSMKTGTRDNTEMLSGLLEMFFSFHSVEDCWHHNRCDKEISHYKQQLTTASKAGKASALKRAMNKNPTSVEQSLDERSTEVQPTNNQEPITINHKPIKENKRGSRLPQDWFLSKSMGDWALQERPDLDVRQVAEQFKDYWVAQAGQKGVKLDWDATWRNWIRNTKAVKPNPYDVVRVTVARSNEPDPALLKIAEDAKKAAPIPLETLARMAQIRQKA